MVNQSVLKVVEIIVNVTLLGVFFSPAPTFYKIIKKKDVEEFKPHPYLATVLSCALWVFYEMSFVNPNNLFNLTINGVGFVLEFVYLTIFFLYANKKGRKKLGIWLIGEAVLFAAVILITMLAIDDTSKRSSIVGFICNIFNIWMYVSPLTIIMEKVTRTKCVKYIPFWLSLANFLNGVCWTIYVLLFPFDFFDLFCNGIGAISGAVLLILYGYYWCKGDNQIKDDNDVPVSVVTAV